MPEGTVCRRGFSSDWFCGSVSLPVVVPSATANRATPSACEKTLKAEQQQCRYVRMGGDYVEVCERKHQASAASTSPVIEGLRKLFSYVMAAMK
ncbi:MAG: hypothetical protein AB1664_19240 [Thermodesulfobacteriota bacterium]